VNSSRRTHVRLCEVLPQPEPRDEQFGRQRLGSRASAGLDELDEYQHAACRTTGRVMHAACRVWHLCRSQAAL
jgi:hypothetical protein